MFALLRLVCGGTYDSDGVVEQRLAKDDNVKNFIDVDFFKHGQDGDGIDGGNEGREEKRIQQWKIKSIKTRKAASPQSKT